MCLLIRNVLEKRIDMARAHGERPIAVLPVEIGKRWAVCLDPLRGDAFQLFDQIGDRDCPTETTGDMHMVLDTPDAKHRAVELIACATKKLVYLLPQDLLVQKRLSVFGGEHEVQVNLCEGLWHDVLAPMWRMVT